MASLKMLFLGVHTSNSIIRTIFLPACYIILSSPFILAIGWYFGYVQSLQDYISEDFSWFDILPQITLSAVLLLLPTRLLSAPKNGGPSKDGGGARRVQSLPYWIPGIRHLASIMFGGEDWLKGIRESSINNIVVYKAAATKHYVVLSESMLSQIYKHWNSFEEAKETRWGVLRNAFNMPKYARDQYFDLHPAISTIIDGELLKDGQRRELISISLRLLTESLPDFATFNSSIVDQMQWERVANVELTDGTSEAEADLFALLNEFCCNAVLPPIVGAQFTESYQLLATDLATLNSKFWALSLGLPRLSPIQGLPGAALAQKRLNQNFKRFLSDLTYPPVRRVVEDDESVSGEEETDADVVTPLMKLNDLFKEKDVAMDVRAAIALELVQNIMAEIVPLTFWTLLHIFSGSDSSPTVVSALETIRKETKTWSQAFQPPSIHPSFPAPPEIRFTTNNIITSIVNSPNLISCINESRRLYGCSVKTYKITSSITLEESSSTRDVEQEKWEIEGGSFIDVGVSSSLINSSEANYISAATFQPDRFVNSTSSASIVSSIHSTQAFKISLISAIVAGVTQLWDIAPAPKKSFFDHLQEASAEASIGASALSGEQKEAQAQAKKEKEVKEKKVGKWLFPKAVDGASVKVPKTDIRVRIRRREGLPASKIVGRIG